MRARNGTKMNVWVHEVNPLRYRVDELAHYQAMQNFPVKQPILRLEIQRVE
jgi:hypothetical protein